MGTNRSDDEPTRGGPLPAERLPVEPAEGAPDPPGGGTAPDPAADLAITFGYSAWSVTIAPEALPSADFMTVPVSEPQPRRLDTGATGPPAVDAPGPTGITTADLTEGAHAAATGAPTIGGAHAADAPLIVDPVGDQRAPLERPADPTQPERERGAAGSGRRERRRREARDEGRRSRFGRPARPGLSAEPDADWPADTAHSMTDAPEGATVRPVSRLRRDGLNAGGETRRPADRPLFAPSEPRPSLAHAPSPMERRRDGGGMPRRAQRQEGGGTVVIDGGLYALLDWSVGGLAIGSDGQLYRLRDRRVLEIEIDQGDYAVNLDIEAEVVNRDSSRTGWRFLAPSETQRQVLRALAFANRGGKLQLPRAQRRGTDWDPRADEERPRRSHPARVMTALLSLPFNLAVIAVICLAVYLLAARAPADAEARPGSARQRYAAVAVERVALTTVRGGTVTAWALPPGGATAEGAPLMAFAEPDGRSAVLASPCDCVVGEILAPVGTVVPARGDVASLYARDAATTVQALFLPEDAPRPGTGVAVTVPSIGTTVRGEVTAVSGAVDLQRYYGLARQQIKRAAGAVAVHIATEPALPAELAGNFVTVQPDV